VRPRVFALVPVGTLEGAKSRLGGALDAEERHDLAVRLLRRTLAATTGLPAIAETIVVTPDDEVRTVAAEERARPIRQQSQGLNRGLAEARDEAVAAGADAVLVLPMDLPFVSADALEAVLAPLLERAAVAATRTPLVVLVPDRHGRGTNALLVAPPGAIEFGFGGDSRAGHAQCAAEAGAAYVELTDGPLSVDLDTPEDLLVVQELSPEAAHAQ